MDRASDSGSEGWGFESLPVYQKTEDIQRMPSVFLLSGRDSNTYDAALRWGAAFQCIHRKHLKFPQRGNCPESLPVYRSSRGQKPSPLCHPERSEGSRRNQGTTCQRENDVVQSKAPFSQGSLCACMSSKGFCLCPGLSRRDSSAPLRCAQNDSWGPLRRCFAGGFLPLSGHGSLKSFWGSRGHKNRLPGFGRRGGYSLGFRSLE